jgi:hypothetical protein
MKHIRNCTRDIGELNVALHTTFDTSYWQLVFSRISYDEVVFDAEKGTVTYPEFIPLEDMIRDVAQALEQEQTATCVACRRLFLLNEEDGIFGDPENLSQFLCKACSETISAREFYYKYLRGRG